jgi:hypothetical protein
LPFKRTFKDGDSWWRFQKVLDENSVKVEQMLRGNHGGGCPRLSMRNFEKED